MADKLDLHIAQRWMQGVLVNPLGGESHPSDILPEALKGSVEKIIAPSSRMSGRQRLAIYQRSYLARLRDCMANQFRALKYTLGEELFQNFADDYLQQYPSESHTLADLGNRFAQFLGETRPDRDLPMEERDQWPDFMIELVQFEYAINQVFDAHYDREFEYANANTPDESLELVDSLTLFHFSFPVNQYYQAVIRGDKPEMPVAKLSPTIIVRKKNYRLGLFDIDPQFYLVLDFWKKSGSLDSALEKMTEQTGMTKANLEELWEEWKLSGLEYSLFKVSPAVNG